MSSLSCLTQGMSRVRPMSSDVSRADVFPSQPSVTRTTTVMMAQMKRMNFVVSDYDDDDDDDDDDAISYF